MHNLFARHSFKIILVMIFVLPLMTRGARKALTSNDNNVHDWLPSSYVETTSFNWFKERFDNETFILISWEGCVLGDERLELLARKLVLPRTDAAGVEQPALFKKVETGDRVMNRLTSAPLNIPEDEALARLQGLFIGPDNQQTCAVITLTDEGKRDLRYTLKSINRLAEGELALPPTRIRMGGPPVDNVAISTEGEKTLMWLFIPAGIIGISLAYWCLRSVRLTTMVFGAALYAGAVSLAIVYYSQGTMNAILLTMPAVVYVAGISGAIHFANYYRDSVVEQGVSGAAVRAIRHAWVPCTLAAATTAAGLFSLYTSELVPIKMFGVYSALGVLATLLILFVLLPAWMELWPMKAHSLLDGSGPKLEDLSLPVRWRKFLSGVLTHHRPVFFGLLLLMIFCGYGLTKVRTSIKLTKLFSPQAEIIKNYEWLEQKLGPLVPMEIVIRLDTKQCNMTFLERMELVNRAQQELATIEGIGNTMSAVTFAPSLKVKRIGLLSKQMVRGALNKKLAEHREEYEASGFLHVEGDKEYWRISARVGALNDIDYGEFINDIRAKVEPVLSEQREAISARNAAAAPAVAAAGGQEENVAPVTTVAEVESTASAAALGDEGDLQGVAATYTGLVPVVYKAQRSMLNGLIWNFVTDLLTIALVMTIFFGDLSAGLILLVPSVFPLVIVFGLMGWMGILIDVGTVMTPTVALGVSVDDVVHFLIWYRKGLSEGKSRRESTMLAYEGCARAMYQSWAVLGLGLAVFSFSSFVPTQRFGALMFTLLTAALIANLFLLPTVLTNFMGHFFGRRLIRKATRERLAAAGADGTTLMPHLAGEGHIDPAGPRVSPPKGPGHVHVRHDSAHGNVA